MKQVYIVEARHPRGFWYMLLAFTTDSAAHEYVRMLESEDDWGDGLRVMPIGLVGEEIQ